jgi:hypothetical protein
MIRHPKTGADAAESLGTDRKVRATVETILDDVAQRGEAPARRRPEPDRLPRRGHAVGVDRGDDAARAGPAHLAGYGEADAPIIWTGR